MARVQVKDPVCGMQVEPHSHEIVYQEMHFAFCSEQCKNRFLAHPHLYVGFPNQPAIKQLGREVIKRRRLHLSHTLSPEGRLIVADSLAALRGVGELVVDGDTIEIAYDLLQLSEEEIEAALQEIGVRLGENWAERLIRAFVHESEEWEIESLEVTPPRRQF